MTEEQSFNNRVYAVVREIPRGMVATYGQVAALIGAPRCSRFVGFALHGNPEQGEIPCHRVVFRDGSLAPGFAFGGPDAQRALLEAEGVAFIPPKPNGNAGDGGWRVDLAHCQWQAASIEPPATSFDGNVKQPEHAESADPFADSVISRCAC